MSWIKKSEGDLFANTDKNQPESSDRNRLMSVVEEEKCSNSEIEGGDIIEIEDDREMVEKESETEFLSSREENIENNIMNKLPTEKEESDEVVHISWEEHLASFRSKFDDCIKMCKVSKNCSQVVGLLDLLKEKTKECEKFHLRLKRRIQSKSSPSSPKKKRKRLPKTNTTTPPTSPSLISRYKKNISSTPSPKRSKKRKFLDGSSSTNHSDPSNIRRHSSPYISPTASPTKKAYGRSSSKSLPRSPKSGKSSGRKHLSPSKKKNVRLKGRVLSFELFPAKSKSSTCLYESASPVNSTETTATALSAATLHEKLSSPERKPNLEPHELKRKLQDRQEQATRRRHELDEKKKESYRKSKEKMEKVKQRKEKIREKKIKGNEQRHKKAETKRQEIIGRRVESAREEAMKVKEVKYVTKVTEKLEKKEKRQNIERRHNEVRQRKQEELKKKVATVKTKLVEKESRVKANRERLQLLKAERRKSLEKRSERSEQRVKEIKHKEMIKRKKKIEEHIEKVKKTKLVEQRRREEAKERILQKIREVEERKKVSIQTIRKKAERALEKVRQAKKQKYHHKGKKQPTKKKVRFANESVKLSSSNSNSNSNSTTTTTNISEHQQQEMSHHNSKSKSTSDEEGFETKKKSKKRRPRSSSQPLFEKKKMFLQQYSKQHQQHSTKKNNDKSYRVPSRIFEERLRKSKEELFKFKKKYFPNSKPNNTNTSTTTISLSELKTKEKKLREVLQHMNSLLSTKKSVPNSMVSNVTRNLRKLISYDTKYLAENKKVFLNFFRFYHALERTSRARSTMIQFFLYLVNECKVSNFLMRSLMITKFFEMTVQALHVGDIRDAVILVCILITCLSDEFHALKCDNDVQIRFARIVTQVLSSYGLIHQVVQLIHDYAVSGGWPDGRAGQGWTGLDMSTHIPDYIHNAFYFIREVCREQFFHVLDTHVSFRDESGSSTTTTTTTSSSSSNHEGKSSSVIQRRSSSYSSRDQQQQQQQQQDYQPFVIKVFQTVVCPELTQFLATLILAQGPLGKGGSTTQGQASQASQLEGVHNETLSDDPSSSSSSSSSSSRNTILKTDMSASLIDLTSIILESLNHLARHDIKFVQKFLWNSFEFRHLVHTLLAYTTTFCEERPSEASKTTQLQNNIYGILNQVILLLGYFSCKSPENQNLLHLRTSNVTIVKQLCNLPLQYFSDEDLYMHVVIPTLVCCVYQNETNTEILREEIDTSILLDYVERYSDSDLFLPRFLRKSPEFKLSNRFPMEEIEDLKEYLGKYDQ